MSAPKNPKRKRMLTERTCTCSKCGKICNSTPDKRHRKCGGVWR